MITKAPTARVGASDISQGRFNSQPSRRSVKPPMRFIDFELGTAADVDDDNDEDDDSRGAEAEANAVEASSDRSADGWSDGSGDSDFEPAAPLKQSVSMKRSLADVFAFPSTRTVVDDDHSDADDDCRGPASAPATTSVDAPAATHTCSKCPLTFNSVARLSLHMPLHNNCKTFHVCSLCNVSTFSAEHMQSHIAIAHP